VRASACIREPERYALGAFRQASVRQNEPHELGVLVEPERELDVLVADPVDPPEEVRIVSHGIDLAREYPRRIRRGQATRAAPRQPS